MLAVHAPGFENAWAKTGGYFSPSVHLRVLLYSGRI